ncbi:hypothetical protein [Leisingera sp. M523]|uniref:hypothetical protein n=1 Tax=Leisingera sp. M523 TaxID=2867013 RepID=UPI0021A5C6FF|nr:hypothetical protein [Leisingera sp. M523]UWQ30327.1 hypothetical protein K3557_07290 [Leisingera sp. M523]
MTTLMLLLASHDGCEEIPFRQMPKDYFGIEPEALERNIKRGTIQLGLPCESLRAMRTSNVPLSEILHVG